MINKMQKDYLEKRISNIIHEKMKSYDAKNSVSRPLRKDVVDALRNNKLSLKQEFVINLDRYFDEYDSLSDFFDMSVIFKEYRDASERREKYKNKLEDKGIAIMDKVMFEELNIEDAISELDSMEK